MDRLSTSERFVMKTIHAVRGRVLRINDSDNPGELHDYQLAQQCKVFLNGEPKTVAALENGDAVIISGGNKEGFHQVTATRARKRGQQSASPSKGRPQSVILESDPQVRADIANKDVGEVQLPVAPSKKDTTTEDVSTSTHEGRKSPAKSGEETSETLAETTPKANVSTDEDSEEQHGEGDSEGKVDTTEKKQAPHHPTRRNRPPHDRK